MITQEQEHILKYLIDASSQYGEASQSKRGEIDSATNEFIRINAGDGDFARYYHKFRLFCEESKKKASSNVKKILEIPVEEPRSA